MKEPKLVRYLIYLCKLFHGLPIFHYSKAASDEEVDPDFKPRKRGRPGRKKVTPVPCDDDDDLSVGGTPTKPGTPAKPVVQGGLCSSDVTFCWICYSIRVELRLNEKYK